MCPALGCAPRQAASISARYFQVSSGRDISIAPDSALDRHTLVGVPVVVQPTDTSVGRQPRIRRHPRAGYEQDALGLAAQGGDFVRVSGSVMAAGLLVRCDAAEPDYPQH